MLQPKKFGTFGGVFTPSILTILGVIMYMRLGWVVGSAGTLTVAIIIILMAHLVSLTTGLSVSSVATDKKIKAGGIYYMLSRSLGLPIGGSIGITLFVATGLSIALYLIGFAESAMAILKEPLGIQEVTLNHLRIVGSIALFIIVTIAFISTSIAIKSQYFILGAIVLSLLSVFFGTADGKEFDMSAVEESGVSFAVLFGIFFPAVTGFTAGVAMSGDLKDPKKSIPWGTMLSIFTGLIVYVVLAIFIFYSIDQDILVSDKNALVVFGLVPGLVIAGIWGATLSSALGGILGAPRILQAMSLDGITPKLFAKGVGAGNEPRNALLLTFVLAELGILIGELDVIAEVVAMFYMTAYLFINVTCLLEQWASPDFLPKFKIPLFVPLLGAVVTFLLMIQLNLVAAVISILIMVILFLFLAKRQLDLGSGDVWQNVWYGVVKLGLKNLINKKSHKRNWEPNIVSFLSDDIPEDNALAFSSSLAGKLGFISQFKLIDSSVEHIRKEDQSVTTKDSVVKGIFKRKVNADNYWEGVLSVAQYYGFSGVEPNTILLDWKQSFIDKERFKSSVDKLIDWDYNICFLHYNDRKGFGNKKKIDIWWNNLSNTTELTLSIAKFFSQSLDWRNAEIIIKYVGDDANDKALKKAVNELKELFRLKIETKFFNKKEFTDTASLIAKESDQTDLIFIELPTDEEEQKSLAFILDKIGSTVLIHASSYFDDFEIIKEVKDEKNVDKIWVNAPDTISSTIEIKNEQYIGKYGSWFESSFTKNHHHYIDSLRVLSNQYQFLIDELLDKVKNAQDKLKNKKFSIDEYELQRTIGDDLLSQMITTLNNNETEFSNIENKISASFSHILNQEKKLISLLPTKYTRALTKDELLRDQEDGILTRIRKILKRRLSTGKGKLRIPIKEVVNYQYQHEFLAMFKQECVPSHSKMIQQYIISIEHILETFREGMIDVVHNPQSNGIFDQQLISLKTGLLNIGKSYSLGLIAKYSERYRKVYLSYINAIIKDVKRIRISSIMEERTEKNKSKHLAKKENDIYNSVSYLGYNQQLTLSRLHYSFNLCKLFPEIEYLLPKIEDKVIVESTRNTISLIKQVKKNDKDSWLSFFSALQPVQIENKDFLLYVLNSFDKQLTKLPSELNFATKNELKGLPTYANVKLKGIRLSFKETVRSFVKEEYYEILLSAIDSLERGINNIVFDLKTKVKLIEVADFNDSNEEKELYVRLTLSCNESLALIDNRLHKFNSDIVLLKDEILERFLTVDNAEIGLSNNIKSNNSVISPLANGFNKLKNRTIGVFEGGVSYLNAQRESFIKQELKNKTKSIINDGSKIRDFLKEIKLKEEVKSAIPLEYLKIFVGEKKTVSELKNRDTELLECTKAIFEIKKNGGCLAIVGEHLAGKRYFTNYLVSQKIEDDYVIINPIITNEELEICFVESILKAFQVDSLEEAFNANRTTIVFQHVEVWMLSQEVISLLKQIVTKYGKLHTIILCSDINTYKEKYVSFNIDSIINHTVILSHLSRKVFIDTLKEKHLASGLTFSYKGLLQGQFNNRRLNNVFKQYYAIANGNIGVGTRLWVNSIVAAENNRISIKEPQYYYFPDINNNDWLIILGELFLHKKVSACMLNKLFNGHIDVEFVLYQLSKLEIIHEEAYGVYTLDVDVYWYFEQYLKERKLIS